MRKAFTLIELLIVVAIIAILAAIAVPNFLEAQTRSKVARVKSDMRSLATAIESYAVDTNAYPPIVAPNRGTCAGGINGCSVWYGAAGDFGVSSRFIRVTTPIAYITSVFQDAFINSAVKWALDCTSGNTIIGYDTFDYVDAKSLSPGGALGGSRGYAACSGASWHTVSAGPDRVNCYGGGQNNYNINIQCRGVDYDPTNGTISVGDIVRWGGPPGMQFAIKPSVDRVQNVYNFSGTCP
jgi:prepilin-type N-terminal cleavage/methylation domain-containing protein